MRGNPWLQLQGRQHDCLVGRVLIKVGCPLWDFETEIMRSIRALPVAPRGRARPSSERYRPPREIDAVGGSRLAGVLVGEAAVTEHCKARRGPAGGDRDRARALRVVRPTDLLRRG